MPRSRSTVRDARVLFAAIMFAASSVAAAIVVACGGSDDANAVTSDASSPSDSAIDSPILDTGVSPLADAATDAAIACGAFSRPPEGTYTFDLTPNMPVTSVLSLPFGNEGGPNLITQTVTSPFNATVTYDETGLGWTLKILLLSAGRSILSHFTPSASGVSLDHYEELVVCVTAIADCPSAETLTCPPVTSDIGCNGSLVGVGICNSNTDAGTDSFGVTGHHFSLGASDLVTLGNGETVSAYYYEDARTLAGINTGVENVDWDLSPTTGMVVKMEIAAHVSAPVIGLIGTFNQPPLTFVLHSLVPVPFVVPDAGPSDAGKG